MQFDELLLSKTRIGVLALLVGSQELEFTRVRDMLALSDGNLSVQLKKLEHAGYVRIDKIFIDRKPKTLCSITASGRQALEHHVHTLECLIETGRKREKAAGTGKKNKQGLY
jgi:DNA-binding MarR family transcriptional regulator